MSDSTDKIDEHVGTPIAQWRKAKAARMEKTKKAIVQIRQAMKAHGIAECHVRYSGSGDSGDGETGLYVMEDGSKRAPTHNAHWENEDTPRLEVIIPDYRDTVATFVCDPRGWVEVDRARSVELSEIMCDVAMEYVCDRHGGWENNEGGFGEVTITATAVIVDHSDYITETVNSVEQYDDGEDGEDD